jgi:hypothetical protein
MYLLLGEIWLNFEYILLITVKNRLILVLTFFALIPLDIHSQTSDTGKPQKKAALVIGNGNYLTSILPNPENDAKAMSAVLKKIGFEVFEYENLNQSQMKKAIDDFGLKLKNVDVGLFFYAGHGIQSKGYNYLIPVDASLESEAQVEYDCVQADRILAFMEESDAKVKIMILDACRNNPFERSWTRAASGKGLATMDAPIGTIIGYATAPGHTASDGSGKNGLYTSALLESIVVPGISISQLFQNVARIVSQKSDKQQIPWIASSLTAEFYFTNKEISQTTIRNDLPVTEPTNATAPAQIYKLNGEVLSVKIIKISPSSVDFYIAGEETNIKQEPKSNLSKILYTDGHEEIFSKTNEITSNTNYPKINGQNDWQLVVVTEDKSAIIGLKEVQKLKANSFWGGAIWTKKGVDACYADLKKKAAELGCPVVLVTDKKTGGVTSVEGIAYK